MGEDAEGFEGGGEFVGVDLYEAHEGADTGGEGTVSDDNAERGLSGSCFEGRDGYFVEGCDRGVSEGGEM